MLRYEKALVVQGMNHTGERAEEAAMANTHYQMGVLHGYLDQSPRDRAFRCA